eukprot:1902687-Rhodomonas_salina.1
MSLGLDLCVNTFDIGDKNALGLTGDLVSVTDTKNIYRSAFVLAKYLVSVDKENALHACCSIQPNNVLRTQRTLEVHEIDDTENLVKVWALGGHEYNPEILSVKMKLGKQFVSLFKRMIAQEFAEQPVPLHCIVYTHHVDQNQQVHVVGLSSCYSMHMTLSKATPNAFITSSIYTKDDPCFRVGNSHSGNIRLFHKHTGECIHCVQPTFVSNVPEHNITASLEKLNTINGLNVKSLGGGKSVWFAAYGASTVVEYSLDTFRLKCQSICNDKDSWLDALDSLNGHPVKNCIRKQLGKTITMIEANGWKMAHVRGVLPPVFPYIASVVSVVITKDDPGTSEYTLKKGVALSARDLRDLCYSVYTENRTLETRYMVSPAQLLTRFASVSPYLKESDDIGGAFRTYVSLRKTSMVFLLPEGLSAVRFANIV